jgi:cyclopropane fatty-acyl-phospholipid synthase-like methyltransferase
MYCNSSDFIKRHIFPGGHLPAKSSVEAFISGLPLSLVHVHDIGPHYAPTLRMWRLRFKANREKILALGYSDVFYRKWVFYFAYCEAAFANRCVVCCVCWCALFSFAEHIYRHRLTAAFLYLFPSFLPQLPLQLPLHV